MIPKTLRLLFLCLFLTAGINTMAQPGTCTKGGFQAVIGDNGQQTANDLKECIGGKGYVLAGSTTENSAGGTDALLIVTDTNGVTRWAKTYGSIGNDGFNNVILTKDGNYLAIGWSNFTNRTSDIFVAKIDPNGSLLWSRSYGAGTTYGENGHAIAEMDDGTFVIAADYNSEPTQVQSIYMKINASGDPVWIKMLQDGGSSQAYGLVIQGDMITGTGVVARGGSSTYNDGYLVKLRAGDGSIVWTKNIESENRSNRLEAIRLKNNQYILDMYNTDTWVSGNVVPMIFTTDTSGNIIYDQSYEITGFQPNWPVSRGIFPTADGGYLSAISELNTNTSPRFVKVGSSGAVDWTDNFVTYTSQQMRMSLEDADGNMLAVGQCTLPNGATDILFIKTNPNGLLGDNTGQCQVTHPTATNRPIPITISDAGPGYWTNISDGNITAFTPLVSFAPYLDHTTYPCDGVEHCRTLNITGKDTLCDWHTLVNYLGVRDPGCTSQIAWSVDNPAIATAVKLNDSTVTIQFNAPGSVTLHGEITTTCAIISADKKIWAFDSIPVRLGNDTGICVTATLTLDAGPGFLSYDWSTGAATQKITVNAQGQLRVTAAYTPSCISRDTIELAMYDPRVNLGPDTSLCRNDTYTFNANGIFNDYQWQDGSTNSSFTTDQPGKYWIRVHDSHNCVASDTAYILTIHELPAGFLSPTATICTDDFLVLQPEGIWSSYLWSTNAVTDTTTITAPGPYWLEVTDRFGCKGRENTIVVAADCRRDIYFPGAFTPNGDGNNDVFRPKVYGTLAEFYMAIFNRWGEKVFETRDATRGWNGVFKGILQSSNSFVWYAVYRFSGRTQHQQKAKGNLTLVR